ncbi:MULTISPECIES: pyruvate dehydrogenase complex dihydrolipoamide acetyltransferase [Sphingobium]|uniref:pyruvate dehydrogenase complex dihydrolipoamide acetyltransferase n=1 Tax=Sphingobium sp. MI1205 TaxID=407020 RepID=UPI00076FF23C|nr:pyruvate dehydrogenase complex dihydrolipoamide acetyltransferase [Sphingobium sp. MI1205]AMK19595.1 dihydrolipoyllysine-residue acetyltransferase [Sphingobium sp. MI1205]
MAIELKMPALSPTMEKGTLAKWLVAEGDTVRSGDLLAEIETDKATMEFEAVEDGRIAQLVVAAGTDDVAVGTVIALMADGSTHESRPAITDAPKAADKPESITISSDRAAEPVPPPSSPGTKVSDTRFRISPAERIRVSPLALRIAETKGIDLSGIQGSGPHGRIVRADLGIHRVAGPAGDPPPSARLAVATTPPPAGVPVETVKLSSMRKAIARRLTESKQTVPHFYLTARCNLEALLKLRGELNESLVGRGIKLSVNDMLVKAMALALTDVPEANVQFGGEELHRFDRVDISMAVAIDGGLVTPVIKDAGALSLSAIATQSKALAQKARDGKLVPEDYQGGTASISNLGMFGIDEMFPVINPPQAVILGVGAGVEMPWKVNGEIGLATIMAATASFDHRAIDGAIAARFMKAFRGYVEQPMLILG